MTKPRSIVIVPEFSFLFFLFSFLRLSFSSSSSPSPSSSSSLPYFARLPSKWRGETLVVPGSFNVIGCWFAREIMSFPLCQTNIVIIPDFREWNEICWMYQPSLFPDSLKWIHDVGGDTCPKSNFEGKEVSPWYFSLCFALRSGMNHTIFNRCDIQFQVQSCEIV